MDRAAASTDLFSGQEPAGGGDDVKCGVCGVDPCACGIEIAAPPRHSQILPMVEAAPAPAPARLAEAAPFRTHRDTLAERHGDRSVAAADRPLFMLASDLRERAGAISDRLRGGREPDAEQAAIALTTLETLGAIALTLHERLKAIVAGEEREG